MLNAFTAAVHLGSQAIYEYVAPPFLCSDLQREQTEEFPDECWVNARFWSDARDQFEQTYPEIYYQLMQHFGCWDKFSEYLAEHFSSLMASGGRYVTFWDEHYPPLLRYISDPPLGLSVLGTTEMLLKPLLAIIGSRKANARSLRFSFDSAVLFSLAGFGVVSGGALGCDVAAHHGALQSHKFLPNTGCTIAVFAGGLGSLYPRANQRYFDRMRDLSYPLVSERHWFATSRPMHYAARNRIVAGMTEATIVSFAGYQSGAIITANFAAEYGRDVFFLDQSQTRLAVGTSWLQDHGGMSVKSARELAERFNLLPLPQCRNYLKELGPVKDQEKDGEPSHANA